LTTLDDVLAVCRFMNRFDAPWWVAAGWAIDLWLGEVNREHSDIEIGLLREDQRQLREYCTGWRFFTPVAHQWVPVAADAQLEYPDEFQYLIRAEARTALPDGLPDEFEFMLNNVRDGLWQFRPNPTIRLPYERAVLQSPLGMRVIAPEAVLLHKCRHLRPKDEQDFTRALARLDAAQRQWLHAAIAQIRPDHPWLERL
jgi:hypothetical protein